MTKITKTQLLARCEALEAANRRLTNKLDWQERRLTIHAEAQEAKITQLVEAMGGAIWRTMAGHARGIAFLSTQHLNNILLFPGASDDTKRRVQCEIDRRNIDEKFRKLEKSGRKAPTDPKVLGRLFKDDCKLELRATKCKAGKKRTTKRRRTNPKR